jgi:hypothetical protein
MNTITRASGSPAATQRSQNTDTMSVSDLPARPACVSHAESSAKKASFTPRLYNHDVRSWVQMPSAGMARSNRRAWRLPGLISDDPASRNTSVLTHHAIFPVYWGSLRKFFEAVANANLGQLSFFPRGAHGRRRQLLSDRPSDRGQRGNHSRRGN